MASRRKQSKEYFADYRARNRERLRAYQKAYKAKNRVRLSAAAKQLYQRDRTRHLRKYGLTQADYDRILEKQNGRCAICCTDNPGKRAFHVDHCHKTGKIRGLLCLNCNSAIGFIADDFVRWHSIKNYLWTTWNNPAVYFNDPKQRAA